VIPSVPEVVLAVDDALEAAALPHAFGGALALAYAVGEPRATIDVDVNVFLDAEQAERAFAALPRGVAWGDDDVELAVRDGQVRVWWGDVALDLFFDYHPFHAHAAGTALTVPFADRHIRVLAPDELAVFKAFFDRTKDWADLEAMVEVGSFDVGAVRGWLVRLLGEDDPRVDRLDRTLATTPSGSPARLPPLRP
jgi:hypothetical protein